ncbi:hypothetical protein GGG17_13060 [Arsenicicoccus sp. MKL-02]|uniref:DUF308 domain-containing protein n=1 Tax=Arsenicicoccus cauae TaxID=2663847 RepID=A0A6I3IGL6_9MICO|nr:hypothetical protein [Arsenicicoccus cauae]MTB72877.1 hypothetical protein [Arsenicicoccus cauae]
MGTHEPDDINARFEEIVARWDDEDGSTSDDLPGEGRPGQGAAAGPAHAPESVPPPPPTGTPQQRRALDPRLVYRDPASGLSMGTDHRSWSPPVDPDDPDDRYVPPPPAPMPSWRSDPVWWAILVGLCAGPLVLLLLVLTGHTTPRIYLWLAGLATVAAFAGLVLRLPSTHDEDDDGARV